MSIIKEYIDLQNWQKALSYKNSENQNKRTRFYLARAHYEQRNYQAAYQLIKTARRDFINDWNNKDENKYKFYRNMKKAKVHSLLPPEESAHSKYCESIKNQDLIIAGLTH